MLSRLRLQNFKSFVDQEIELGPLVIMVGANASGKSNFLDAIRFLQGVGLGMTFTEILRGRWEGGRQIWPGIRGGIQEIASKGSRVFSVGSTWSDAAHQRLSHEVEVDVDRDPLLENELLRADSTSLLDSQANALGGKSGRQAGSIRFWLKKSGQGRGITLDLRADRSALLQVRPQKKLHPHVEPAVQAVLDSARSSTFLDITPARMREYVPRATDQLGSEGENLSAIMFELCQNADDKQDLVDWLSELVAPELEDLDFVETELGDVMLELVEPGGTKIPARSLSDGTLRFLGQLVALKTAKPGSLLLIEEVDSGLHPQRVHLLVEALSTATRERGVQVIATTHSPLVLSALDEAALNDTVLCARDPEEPGSVLRRLSDLPYFDEVAGRRGADYLMTTGWLERAL